MKITARKDEMLLDRSRSLRRKATKEENNLWYDFLKKHKLDFYRQRVIEGYIADFYCPKAGLVIELDGGQHYLDEAMDYDERRTKVLEALGIEVIRFTNRQVRLNFESVCYAIDLKIEERLGRVKVQQSINPTLKADKEGSRQASPFKGRGTASETD